MHSTHRSTRLEDPVSESPDLGLQRRSRWIPLAFRCAMANTVEYSARDLLAGVRAVADVGSTDMQGPAAATLLEMK